MRRIAILAALVLSVAFILAFSATAFATSPHTGYAGTTDFCIACHDVHEASGDYVLTREATVTAVCSTCHGVFGATAPTTVSWSSAPTNFSGSDPTTSVLLAYEVDMSTMTAGQMNAVPGHSLGVMAGGLVVNSSDAIPGGSATLKVLTSGQYGEFNDALYNGEAASSKTGTAGLYCASCHTPHSEFGQQIASTQLLSAFPNHEGQSDAALPGYNPATDTLSFCIRCHDKRDNGGAEENHPASYCLTCHANDSGGANADFPHTGANARLLYQEPDALCVLCHTTGNLP